MIPSDLDKSKQYSIVGSPKCGTSILGEYMRRNGYDVVEEELNFMDKEYAEKLDRIPIIITRDPVERAWSDMSFFKRDTLEKACEWSRYDEGIKLYNNPIVFKLEELLKLKGFPHHNENITKTSLDMSTRKLIEMELSK